MRKVYPLVYSVLKGVVHLVYEVRIPVMADSDLEVAQKRLFSGIESSGFKVEDIGLVRRRLQDLMYLRVVYGEKEHLKEVLEVVSQEIIRFENYLYEKSIR
jgi:hypothetical protein